MAIAEIRTAGNPPATPVGQSADYSAAGLTLGGAARIFWRTFNARLLALAFLASLVCRVVLGGWRWWDLAIAGIVLGVQPFTEWLIHVFVLHAKPRHVGSVTFDGLLARKHRAHHASPKVIALVLVPRRALVTSVVVAVPLYWLIVGMNWRLALSWLVVAYGMFLTYEWVHFLIHSSYKPKRAYYRYVYKAHRLHHFRNENYWYGVTVHLADHVLHTFPDKDDVPVSQTAFTLGVDVAGIEPAA
ncbi:MAG TPA: sterol desaturase family protein [Mycobacteriales bacterium]|nr:sterol desaturase family protein [Mycobacteriales bacterium]